MADRHEEGFCKKKRLHVFSCLQRTIISNDDASVARGTVFQEVRPGAGLKTGDFVKEFFLGGATVRRLIVRWPLLLAVQC